MTPLAAPRAPSARRALGRVALTAVLANSTWFSATAVVPALTREWGLTAAGAAWLAIAVQAGFIAGSVGAALLNLPDRVEPRVLTLGSATPHLVRGLGDVPWQATILATSGLALLAATVIRPVGPGVHVPATPPLDVGAAASALRERPVRLTTLGYLGHMWELYAFWAWLPAFFIASRRTTPGRLETGAVVFAAFGLAGLAGSVAAGRLADRIGRTSTTSLAMLVSAGCCLASPLAFEASTAALGAMLVLWGASVIADSAQFSAAVTELAEPRYAGSVLTLQLALGFALTIASIRLVPVFASAVGWRFALLPLAAGPLAGTASMLRLRGLPASRRPAGGRG